MDLVHGPSVAAVRRRLPALIAVVAAIGRVEDAIQKWGKLTVVYRAQDADIILMVESRPSEDVLAVYDAHSGDAGSGPSQTYLWRVMGRGGLQKSEIPLFSQFEKAWDEITH